MKKGIRILMVLWCAFTCLDSSAQKGTTSFGIQVKPIIPSKFFDSGPESTSNEEVEVVFTPKVGINFGMFIRMGFTDMFSFETGINLVNRNYDVTFDHQDLSEKVSMDFRFVGYEIPLQGLIFVQLGKRLWMNASGGFSIDMYPSNVQSQTYERVDSVVYDFSQKTWRNGWLQFALLANYGFEWRTAKSGSFYLGASFHRPFADIAETLVVYKEDDYPTNLTYSLSGTYLTLDLRYIFANENKRK